MAICDRRQVNMSKQTTTVADIDLTPPLGLSYGHVIWFISRVIRFNSKPFEMKDLYVFSADNDYVEMSCTGREIGLVVLALRC